MQSTIVCKIYTDEITGQTIKSSVVNFCRKHSDKSVNTAIIQCLTIKPSTISGRPMIEMVLTSPCARFATELKASVVADTQDGNTWLADHYIEGVPQVTVVVTSGSVA